MLHTEDTNSKPLAPKLSVSPPETVNMIPLLQWCYAIWTSLLDDWDIVQVKLDYPESLERQTVDGRRCLSSPAWERLNDCYCFGGEAPMQNTDELLAITPTTNNQKQNGCLSMTSVKNDILPKLAVIESSPAANGNSQPRSCNLAFGDPEQTAQLCNPRPLTFRNTRLLKMDFKC